MGYLRVIGLGLGLSLAAAGVTVAQPTQPFTATTAAVAPLSKPREDRLRARVTDWHEARRQRDQRAMYELLEPDYRKKVDFGAYSQQTAVRTRFSLVKYEILALEPQADDKAVVRVRLEMDLGRFGSTPTEASDTWIWRDGDWWLIFKEFRPPFPPA